MKDIDAPVITVEPLKGFPVIKDLVVDMDGHFKRFEQTLGFFEPKEVATEPARIVSPKSSTSLVGAARRDSPHDVSVAIARSASEACSSTR